MERATPDSPMISVVFAGSAVTSIPFTEERVRGQRGFAGACRKMSPLVTTRALGQNY
jgi:hypothetical protein